MLTLISATPSPYARKNRIAMIEKGIPFDRNTKIQPFGETSHSSSSMMAGHPSTNRGIFKNTWFRNTKALDDQLMVKKIQVLADGACDAMGLVLFETARGESMSKEWLDRQMRKVNGVIKAMDELVRANKGKFLVCDEFSVADIAVGAMLGMMNMVETKYRLIH
jgi:glutathione S-transferase